MGPYKGDYPTGFAPPLVFMFATFSSDDPSASVALSGIAVTDIEVYKNGSVTQRASDLGYALLDTDGIDFDGKVGIGGFSIDIDNNDDAGFFAAGQEYDVVLASITVDGATINFHPGSFSIERAGGALATALLTNTVVDGIAAKLAGITLLNEWLGAIAGKQNADATALAEIKASGAGSGTYDPNTDSTEAVRDRGDAAWITATGFNTTTPPTVAEIQAEIEENAASLLDTIRDELANGADGLTALKTAIDAIPTTMVGTNNAALASVVGALADGAAGGEVTTADTLMQYLKQLSNILIGGPGIVAFPAEAAPGNAVSLSEVIRAIHVDTNKLAFTVANKVDANITAISGDATAADNLEALMDGVLVVVVNDGSATTTAFATDGFTEASDDHFNGRLMTFISGALAFQQTDITDYDAAGGAQGSQEFSVTALTEAPANNDIAIVT